MTATTQTLSSGIELTFNRVPEATAQDLILSLMQDNLIDKDGNIIDTDNIDNLEQNEQMKLLNTVTDMIQDILLDPNIVSVKVPPVNKWLPSLIGKSYVRKKIDMFKSYGIDNPLANDDIKRFLYIRYVAIESSDDLNVILNNTLLAE